MRRHEMTDEQWQLVEPLLPRQNRWGGGQWRDHRLLLNGVFWRLRTGAPWRDLPERYGPWQTVFDRYNRWRKDGTWDRLLGALQIELDDQGNIDWHLWCIDGSSIRASRAASGAGKKGGLKNPQITHWVAREAAGAANSTWSLTVRGTRWPSTSAPGSARK